MTTATFHPTVAATVELLHQPAARAEETTREPAAKAFYIVTSFLAALMFIMSVGAVASMIYFFTVIYTSWAQAGAH